MKESMTWFRLYADLPDDPKVQFLPAETFRTWINLLCIAARTGGVLPGAPVIAFTLRIPETDVPGVLDEMVALGLIDQTPAGLIPHNWGKRQYKSDSSTGRVKEHRNRKRGSGDDDEPTQRNGNVSTNVSGNGKETAQRQRQNTEEKDREREARAKAVETDPTTTTTTHPPTFTTGTQTDSPFNPQVYPPSEADVVEFGAMIGVSGDDCKAFWLHFAQQGWKRRNDQAIVDWSLALRAWKVDNDAGLAPKRAGRPRSSDKPAKVATMMTPPHAARIAAMDGIERWQEVYRCYRHLATGKPTYVQPLHFEYAIPEGYEPWEVAV